MFINISLARLRIHSVYMTVNIKYNPLGIDVSILIKYQLNFFDQQITHRYNVLLVPYKTATASKTKTRR